MHLKWLGHSCFLITSSAGVRILTDPFDSTVGYKVPNEEADIVTTSHDHHDHNHLEAVIGEYVHVNTSGQHNIMDIEVTGVDTFHDGESGNKRGSNVVFTFTVDGMKICHLGDLGHILTEKKIEQIGQVDVLLLPVGGTYTIDYKAARELVTLMNPKLVVPMHFKTPVNGYPIDGVEQFLSTVESSQTLDRQEIEIDSEILDSMTKVIVLNYE